MHPFRDSKHDGLAITAHQLTHAAEPTSLQFIQPVGSLRRGTGGSPQAAPPRRAWPRSAGTAGGRRLGPGGPDGLQLLVSVSVSVSVSAQTLAHPVCDGHCR